MEQHGERHYLQVSRHRWAFATLKWCNGSPVASASHPNTLAAVIDGVAHDTQRPDAGERRCMYWLLATASGRVTAG
jgi:hypothetical protein